MIVKFFKYGRNKNNPVKAVKQAVGYLYSEQDANKTQRSVKPETVRGDPQGFSDVVAYGNHAGRYTSGVLSFAESDLDEDAQEKIIDDFEKTLLPGLEFDQYSSLWVRHRDKGRLELHFMFAGEELYTGKRLNAYYHRADITRINAWKDAINVEYGLKDPNHPSSKERLSYSGNLPKERKEIIEALSDYMLEMIGEEVIEPSRDGILQGLKTLNLEVARETKTSISIKNPEGGQNIRLKGSLWERDFKPDRHTKEAVRRRGQAYDSRSQERARIARDRVNELCERRERLNREKYAKPQPMESLRPDNSPASRVDGRNSLGSGSDALPRKQSHRDHTPRPPEPSPVPAVPRSKQPEVLPTITKEKESDADTNRKRNNAIYEEFLEGIRRKRRELKRILGGIYQTVKSNLEKSKEHGEELQRHSRILRDNLTKLRELGRESEHRRRESKKFALKVKNANKSRNYPRMDYHPKW
ncbi:relaxase/mobilization nuclease domain-containing protein [Billgrantia aerodenitrificans]|uniref:Relaxase/mobilization nuclease domain-containing protein n=1 Tax=Billgrantia aerodenitrificans TaxID=2733483 RepID=A0ABS9AWM8_9GAMM|nr:relaxase/mobilization nuclease domain-containing protein [Halomonas aerodenitrificans]MCE8026076.1 relaxase/mobilization nuclease domain-containing protein [Halomonas aerodenitrificans]